MVYRLAIILRSVIVLSIALVMFIFAARFIGSTQPLPEAVQALHLTDCALPCWLGITPGETTFDEAVQRITASHPAISDIEAAESTAGGWYQVGSATVPIIVVADNHGIIAQIMLITTDVKDLTVGDVVNYFGMPTCVDSKLVLVIYSSQTAFAAFGYSTAHERWRMPLNTIEIHSTPEDNSKPCPISTN